MKVINIFLGSIGFLSNISFGALPQEQLNIRDRTTLMCQVAEIWKADNALDRINALTPVETMAFWGLCKEMYPSNISPRGRTIRNTTTKKIKEFVSEKLKFTAEELLILSNGKRTEMEKLKSKKLNQIKEISRGNDLVWTVIDENVYGAIPGWKEMMNYMPYPSKAQRRAISLDNLTEITSYK